MKRRIPITKESAKAEIKRLMQQVEQEATAAGLQVKIEVAISDPEVEKTQAKLQANLASARSQIEAAIECARKLGLDKIEFLGGHVLWGINGEDAAGGPRIFQHDQHWSASTFDCYPTTDEWEWMYGPAAAHRTQDQ